MALTGSNVTLPVTEQVPLYYVGSAARHRRAAPRWSFHRLVAAVVFTMRVAGSWLRQAPAYMWACLRRPVSTTLGGQLVLLGIYCFVAVNAALLVALAAHS